MEKIRKFKTGAIRGSGGKLDFIEYFSELTYGVFGVYMRENTKKYGAGNWQKGFPTDEALKSLRRHRWMLDLYEKYGVDLEPSIILPGNIKHACGILFNVMIYIHEKELERIKQLKKGETLYGYELDKSKIHR